MKTCKARMCRQLVKQTCLQGLGFRFCRFPSLRTTPWISRRTLFEEHVPWWAQIWFTNDVRNQCSKWHYLEGGIVNLERSHRLPRVFLTISIHFHKPMSVPYMFSIAGGFAVAQLWGASFIKKSCAFVSPNKCVSCETCVHAHFSESSWLPFYEIKQDVPAPFFLWNAFSMAYHPNVNSWRMDHHFIAIKK